MNSYEKFNHLVLLVGTNPLPNFVVADYFLKNNCNMKTIWLLHSEANELQAGTGEQARNLEALLRKRWEGKHQNLCFPLEKITLSDVSNAATIRAEIERKVLKRWDPSDEFHLNYTGGTKAMAIHVYLRLQELQRSGQRPFSYLDARNFRLVGDDYGIIADELRQKVQIDFEELIDLHGFQRFNKDKEIDLNYASTTFQKFIDPNRTETISDGHWLEHYIATKLENIFAGKPNCQVDVLHNWRIKAPHHHQQSHFELDGILVYGYHLTGVSCTIGFRKEPCKNKGFEIILRSRQIGGDEARAILITGSNRDQTERLQDELIYETGGTSGNILVLGVDHLRNEALYTHKIEDFVLG